SSILAAICLCSGWWCVGWAGFAVRFFFWPGWQRRLARGIWGFPGCPARRSTALPHHHGGSDVQDEIKIWGDNLSRNSHHIRHVQHSVPGSNRASSCGARTSSHFSHGSTHHTCSVL
ncbi:hypothetical protein QBC46DRAFT_395754, partial [Diplogelasinospora grovesii]